MKSKIRAILAIIVSVLMLCSALSVGVVSVSAAPGDVVVDYNFDDGSNGGFDRSFNENGYIVFDATTADWQNTYAYMNLNANTLYKVTFSAKANKDASLAFKINNNWAGDTVKESVAVTTEWQDFELIVNSGELAGAIVMFASDYTAGDAAIYCIDNLKIVETVDPALIGKVINGDFENGSEGWILNDTASVENGALKIDNCNQWAEAAMANIAVEVGTEYTLSWKSQRISGNGAFLMFVLKGDNSNHASSGQNWMNNPSTDWVENSLKFTAEEAYLKLKLSAEVADPGVILIDDIKLTAVPKPVVGQITNGDFETGDLQAWNKWQDTEVNAAAAHSGSYGANIKGNGGWGGMLDQHFQVEDGKTYEFSFWYKVNSSGFNWSLKGDATGTNYTSGWVTASEWTQVTQTFIASGDTSIFLNINGGGNGVAEDAYIDDIKLFELKDPSDDGFIKNGDFETGKAAPWSIYSTSEVCAEAAHSGDYGLKMISDGGWGGTGDQTFTIEAGKSYRVTMWIKTIENGVNVQIQDGGNTVAGGWVNNAPEWTQLTYEFTATSANGKINFCGGGNGIATTVYVDDIKVKEMIDPSYDGYITNGDFETGELFPWDNLWGSCPSVEIVEGGKDSAYALSVVSGQWKHVRQASIAVEANTNYKITAWVKNAQGMSLLVKDGSDAVDIVNAGIEAGDEWTEFVIEFNTGDYTSIIFSLMGNNAEAAFGTFDNIVMEKIENTVIYGDANGDGAVNARDAALLQQYVAGVEVTLDMASGDANGDGAVNARDAALLQQYVAGWDVTLGA